MYNIVSGVNFNITSDIIISISVSLFSEICTNSINGVIYIVSVVLVYIVVLYN